MIPLLYSCHTKQFGNLGVWKNVFAFIENKTVTAAFPHIYLGSCHNIFDHIQAIIELIKSVYVQWDSIISSYAQQVAYQNLNDALKTWIKPDGGNKPDENM